MSSTIDILDRIAFANHGVVQPDQLLADAEAEIRMLRTYTVSIYSFNDLRTLRAAWRDEAMAWRRLADGTGTKEEADSARRLTNGIFAAIPEPAGSTFEMMPCDQIAKESPK